MAPEPWQLRIFRHSLKKQQKLHALLRVLGELDDKQCLLVTCGDNNGALNWYFKRHGGSWSWADTEPESILQIGYLIGDPVTLVEREELLLPYPAATFDVVLTIDVHEHLEDPQRLNEEIARIVKPNGIVIVTTPNGDERKLANRIKRLVGMGPEDYGHVVTGYDINDLQQQLQKVDLNVYTYSSYSRFFTEMIELLINFVYVKVLSHRSKAKVTKGQIAPQNLDQLRAVDKSYKMYALIYPLVRLVSKLDILIGFTQGYAVIVAAKRK